MEKILIEPPNEDARAAAQALAEWNAGDPSGFWARLLVCAAEERPVEIMLPADLPTLSDRLSAAWGLLALVDFMVAEGRFGAIMWLGGVRDELIDWMTRHGDRAAIQRRMAVCAELLEGGGS